MVNEIQESQWAYLIDPCFELTNSAGKPLTGGYIEVYIHGTRNKYYCASDWNGTLHPFQIPLDSLGSNIVLASPAHALDVYVYNKYGSLVMSRYNVLPQVQGTSVVSGEVNITSNDNTVTITQTGDNNFDLSIAGTVSTITDMVTDTVSAVSSNLMNEIIETAQEVSALIPDVSNFTTHTEVNEAIVTAIDLVTSIIPTEQVQSDWRQNNPAEPDYIKNKPNLDDYVTENELVTAITAVTGMIPSTTDFATHSEVYNSSVTAINLVTSIIPEAQVQSNWTETDTTDPSYIQNKPDEYTVVAGQNIGIFVDGNNFTIAASGTDLTNYATHSEVNTVSGAIVSLIPDAQVQSDWDQSDNTKPDYIKHKPNLSNFVTDQEFIEVVSGVTGVGDYGQFYSTAVSGGAIMSRTKGTIDVTNDGKIKLKKGNSYHVTVRGRYNASTLTNVYGNISYIEYITFNPIYINVDKTISESQYFEISYDLYQLNSDSDYYVFFSGLDGTINDLYIEIHAIGHVGSGGTVTGSAEYDAGWGIQILNNVISVNPSIIPDDINLVAGQNIGITVSGSNLVIAASGSDLSDYATLEQLQDSVELVTGLIPTVQLNGSDQVTAINNYPIYSQGGGTQYSAGDGIDITNNVISVDNTVALKSDIPAAQVQSNWTETNTSSKAYIQNKPLEYSVVAGQNIGIAVNGTNLVISASNPDLTSYATHTEVNNVSGAIVNLIPPAQVQSNWNESNTSSKAYIQNKPNLNVYATHTEVNNVSAAIVNEIPDVSNYATHSEVNTVSGAIVNLIPDVSDFATVSQVTAVSGYLQNEINNIPAQEQADWSQTDNTQVDYIKNKPDLTVYATHTEVNNVSGAIMNEIPDVSNFVTESEVNTVSGILEGHIQTVSAAIPDISNLATKTEVANVETDVQIVSAAIPDVSQYATHSEVNNVSGTIVAQIPDISGLATKTEVQTIANDVQVVSAAIPSLNGYATETYVTNAVASAGLFEAVYGTTTYSDIADAVNKHKIVYCRISATGASRMAFLAYIGTDNYEFQYYRSLSTHSYDSQADEIYVYKVTNTNSWTTTTRKTGYNIKAGTNLTYSISGNNLTLNGPDLSSYVTNTTLSAVSGVLEGQIQTVSAAIPDVSSFVTESELQDGLELVTGLIPTVQLNGSDQVTAINNYPIYSQGGGTTYTAGDHIGIVNDEISVTGITELVAGNAITITTSGASAIISSTGEAQVQANWNETNTSSKAYIQNKPTIPAAQVQSNWNETNSSSKAYIQNKPTIHNYTGASGINISNDTITLDNPIELVAVSGIEITVSGVSAIISASGIMNMLGDVETALSNL